VRAWEPTVVSWASVAVSLPPLPATVRFHIMLAVGRTMGEAIAPFRSPLGKATCGCGWRVAVRTEGPRGRLQPGKGC
jgi:hypothetical protein